MTTLSESIAKKFSFEEYKDLFQELHRFTTTEEYAAYKKNIAQFVVEQGTCPAKCPNVKISEGRFLSFWEDNEDVTDIFLQIHRLQIETDDSLIYRNRLWLERLKDRILPSINGEPFILVVGASHALVRAESKEKLGVLDFFEDLVGPENVQLLNRPA